MSTFQENFLKIHTSILLLAEACSVITKANEIYGIDLLLCSTNAFIMVVTKLFRIYMSAAEHKSGFIFLNNEIWMIYGGQFIVMCWVCTLTHREIDKIGPFIEKFVLNNQHSTKFNQLTLGNFRNKSPTRLEICNDSADLHRPTMNLNGFGMETLLLTNFERDCVRNEVNDFMLQLQQYRVKFTACDFFEMDNSLLTRVSTIDTYYLQKMPRQLQTFIYTSKVVYSIFQSKKLFALEIWSQSSLIYTPNRLKSI